MQRINQVGTVRKVSGTDNWVVCEPFIWWIDYDRQEKDDPKVIVPAGFVTNFGSIPRIFWFILSPTEWNAYVLHDYIYFTQYKKNRNVCDRILQQALVAEGCGKLTAFIVYWALFLF